ncbi:MAG: nucleoside deaminase [Nanoarchaeota archaeon]|nr:nucleoside deaminase [Nanoarchaeota archaeon]
MDEDFIKLAINEAKKSFKDGEKTPFGAVIVKNDVVISIAHNTARQTFDPTNHAEINAIRKACQKLKNHHLSDCTLYTTCEPCVMCFAAAWWAKIPKIIYGVKLNDVVKKGQREIDVNCQFLNEKSGSVVEMKSEVLREECLRLFE